MHDASMRKRQVSVVILLAVLALIEVGFYYFDHREPSFEGKSLSEWVLIVHDERPNPEKENARSVVRQLASRSIPMLLRWLREPDKPSLEERISDMKSRIFGWLQTLHIMKMHIMTGYSTRPGHRIIAVLALADLDVEGRRAVIPKLIRMLGDKNHKPDEFSEAAGAAYMALVRMAPESIDPLIGALSNQDFQVWALSAAALGNIGPDAKRAIPVLEKRLNDKDPRIRISTQGIIARVGGDPNKFVPILIHSLEEAKPDDLDYLLDTLSRYKEHGKPAVPILLTILSNTPDSTNPTNGMIRGEVIDALRQIDPEAAARTGAP
jgi:hypothetical protein